MARAGIDKRGRLIADEQTRLVDECSGDGHPLLLSSRQLCRQGPGVVAQADFVQDLNRPRDGGSFRVTVNRQRHGHVLGSSQRRQEG